MDLVIEKTCYKCAGEGVWEDIDPCPICAGNGRVVLPPGGKASTASYIVPEKNLFYSHEVLESIDGAEYIALSDADKAIINLILSCGMVNLNDGAHGRTQFLSIFGGGSTTIANLTALIT